jgi:O-antigen/teichoic acid export membrane protein
MITMKLLSMLIKKVYFYISSDFISKVSGVSVIKFFGYCISFLLISIIAKNYGSSQLGIYQFCLQFGAVLTYITLVGWPQSAIKFAPKFLSLQHVTYFRSWQYTWMIKIIIIACLISYFLFISREGISLFFKEIESINQILYFIIMTLPMLSLSSFIIELLKSQQKIILSEIFRNIIQKTIFLFLLFLPVGIFNDNEIIHKFFISALITFALIFIVFLLHEKKHIKKVFKIDKHLLQMYKLSVFESITMFQSGFLVLLNNNGLILILAYFLSIDQLGIIGLSIQLVALNSFIYGSVMTVAAPKFAYLFSQHGNSRTFYTFLNKMLVFNVISSSILFLVIVLLLPMYLQFLGPEFIENILVVYIFIFTSYFTSMSGPSGALMDITGLHIAKRNITIANLLLLLILLILLAPSYGLLGATIAVCTPKFLSNALSLFVLWNRTGILCIPLSLGLKFRS